MMKRKRASAIVTAAAILAVNAMTVAPPEVMTSVILTASAADVSTENLEQADITYQYAKEYISDPAAYTDIEVKNEGDDNSPKYFIEYFKVSGLTNQTPENSDLIPGIEVNIPDEYTGATDDGEKTLPVRTINDYAFYGNERIVSVAMGNSVKSIGKYSFSSCANLQSVKAANLDTIGANAFKGCKTLATATADSVRVIDHSAFADCTMLTTIPLVTGVETLGNNAFSNCGSAADTGFEISIPETVTKMYTGVFSGANITAINSFGSLNEIPNSTFMNCSNLTEITIPDTITSIGVSAFSNCNKLHIATIPSSVTNIGSGAFAYAGTYVYPLPDDLPEGSEQTPQPVGFIIKCEANSAAQQYAAANNIQCEVDGEASQPDIETIDVHSDMFKLSYAAAIVPQVFDKFEDDAEPETTNENTSDSDTTDASDEGNVSASDDEPVDRSFDIRIDYSYINIRNNDETIIATSIPAAAFKNTNSDHIVFVTLPDTITDIAPGAFDGNFVLVGTAGSYAENYASENKIPFLNKYSAPSDASDLKELYTSYNSARIQKPITDGLLVKTGCMIDSLIDKNISGQLDIPSEIDGTKVLGISDNALASCPNLKAVVLPDGLTSIGNYTFRNDISLEKITLPSTIKTIGSGAFIGTAIASVDLPDKLEYIGNTAFSNTSKLTSVTLPDSINYIGDTAFSYSSLTSINIPDSLRPGEDGIEKIAGNAFTGCRNLTIHGQSGSFAEEYATAHNIAFDNGEAKDDTPPARSDDMRFIEYEVKYDAVTITNVHDYIVKNNEGKETQHDAVPETFAIPAEIDGYPVTQIKQRAFANIKSLKHLTLPDSITSIGAECFNGCESLISVNIPESVSVIFDKTFMNCKSLEKITLSPKTTDIYAYAFSGCTALTSVENLPKKMQIAAYTFDGCKKLIIDNISTMYNIGENSFRGCTSITNLTITCLGNLDIDNNAFKDCKGLTTINFAVSSDTRTSRVEFGEGSFENCINLSEINFPSMTTQIGNAAFKNCTSLKKIDVPASVTMIGEEAFAGCNAVANITILKNNENKSSLTSILAGAFSGTAISEFTIPDTVSTIETELFKDCSNLKTVNTHKNITDIGYNVFAGCKSLTTFTFPDKVTKIHDNMFNGCESLSSVHMSPDTTYIGINAFADCSNLTEIAIPETVGGIEIGAFKNCSGLTTISIPGIYMINKGAFEGCTGLKSVVIGDGTVMILENAFNGCSNITDVILPNSLTTIKENAFTGNKKLTNINLNETSLGSIRSGVFDGCTSLKSITLPNTVTSIAANAFKDSGITEITIPNRTSSISGNAFKSCKSLEKITIPSSTEVIEPEAFADCDKLTIYGYSKSVANVYAIDNNIPFVALDVENLADKSDGEYCGFYYINAGDHIEIIGCKPDMTGDIQVPDTIEDLPVTILKDNAFINKTGITSIDIPQSVITLGEGAFYNCSNLKSVNIKGTPKLIRKETFFGCTSLENITLPESITTIYENAFYSCTSLATVTMKENVSTIAKGAFNNCTSLTRIEIPNSVTEMGTGVFEGCTALKHAVLSENCTAVPANTFRNCKALDTVSMPNGMTTIGDSAFAGCESLSTVLLPTTLTTIEKNAFSKTGLKKIELYDSVTTLGAGTFSGCKALEEIRIPGDIDAISDSLFANCESLTTVNNISKNIKSIKANAFDGCKALTNISIPGTVTAIGENAFRNCAGLTEINLDNVTSMGTNIFSDCKSLKTFKWPTGLNIIPAGTFLNCTALENVEIGDNVTTIQSSAFYSCAKLGDVTVPKSVTMITDNAFNVCDNITLVVYANSTAHRHAILNNVRYRLIDPENDTITELLEAKKTDNTESTGTTDANDPDSDTRSDYEGTGSKPSSGTGTIPDTDTGANTKKDAILSATDAENMVKSDYENRTGNTVTNISTNDIGWGELIVELTDDKGNTESYSVDTGTGSYSVNTNTDTNTGGAVIHSSSEHVNLPKTGVTSLQTRLLEILALLSTAAGTIFMKTSGIFKRRKRD